MQVGKLDRSARAAWPGGTVFLVSAFVIAAAGWALMLGPRLHAADLERQQAEMTQETEAACQRLGMATGSQGFAACAAEMDQLRQRHEDRLHRRQNSLL